MSLWLILAIGAAFVLTRKKVPTGDPADPNFRGPPTPDANDPDQAPAPTSRAGAPGQGAGARSRIPDFNGGRRPLSVPGRAD